MLSDLAEATLQQRLVVKEHVRVLAAQDIYVLLREFEWRRFEAHTARRILQEEAEINVNQMSLGIEQNITIMPVLHIEQVREYRITGQTFREILLRLIKFVAKIALKECMKRPFGRGKLLFQVINGACVRNELNDARVGASYEYFVWAQKYGKVGHIGKNLLESLHELHRQHLLPHVIV